MIRRRVLYLLLVALLMFSFNYRVAAQEGDSETFSNGLTVSGDFLRFYHSVDDPDRLFGQPYTVVFDDPDKTGKQIQYFDRVRMELDPSKPEGQRVSLANLGELANKDAGPVQPVSFASNMCRSINGIPVCYAFMNLYDQYGAGLLGQPISGAEYDSRGVLVQYFTRARMEWRVEMPDGQKVVLSTLGQWDFDNHISNPQLKNPTSAPSIVLPQQIQPKLFAFVARPLMANGSKQTVYALLYNQYNRAIPDATVSVVVSKEKDQDTQVIATLPATKTNDYGFAMIEFPVENLDPNQEIQVTVTAQIANGPTSTASTWFRVWW